MPQRSEALLYVTCIVYALPMTLRIFFLLRYSFQPGKIKSKEQLGQKNQTYLFISNFPVVLHSLTMHIVKFVRFI